MKLKSFIIPVVLLSLSISSSATEWPTVTLPVITSTKTFDITTYGATTSSTDNTTAIQAALDACTTEGGGKVIIPKGTFLCGPIKMGSNTNLFISEGAVLQLLPYGTYPLISGSTTEYPNFIEAKTSNAKNLMISGTGTIYGDGSAWWTAYDAATTKFKRGAVIRFMKCSQIEIRDITMKDAPGSHITIGSGGNANNATIKHVTINTQVPSHNTDGIDVWGTNVNIDSCYISDGDDNIAIDKNSQYIRITNCTFGSGHGTSVGSYTSNVKHVLIDNCIYNGTDNGIRLKSNTDRGGGEEDFMFSNLTMNNVNSAVYIDCYYDKEYTTPANDKANAKAVTTTTPAFKNIYFKNITATSTYKKNNAIFIYGRPEQHVKNITFDNVTISAPYGAVINFADSVQFINGSMIKPATGAQLYSSYDAQIFDESHATAISTPTAATDSLNQVFDLNGRQLLTHATETDTRSLPKGIYIINGRKQTITE